MRGIPALVVALALTGCVRPHHRIATDVDVVLDSLVGGVRFGDDAREVQRRFPAFKTVLRGAYRDSVRVSLFGPARTILFFDRYPDSAGPVPPTRGARLEHIFIRMLDSVEFEPAIHRLTQWLGRAPDTLCAGGPDVRFRVFRWSRSSAAVLSLYRTTGEASAEPSGRIRWAVDLGTALLNPMQPELIGLGRCEA